MRSSLVETFFEGRPSDSPFVEMIWRGQAGSNYFAVCPADVRWNLLFLKHMDTVRVSVEGPLAWATSKTQPEGTEFLVIRFKLGVYMPHLPVTPLVNGDVILPEGASKTFWLHSATWQLPDFENVENFVEKLVRHDLLVRDPIVDAAIQQQQMNYSFRTVRRRFLHATGLTPKSIQQIERANQAAALLAQGVSILDAAYELGYADQPHLTRSLKRFIGTTPAQIARAAAVE
ncbi:MAG: helix-turn-helix domain-containing protein [Anaerolineae bacterium]|nr:helix-turn-helix domain-containing protein [Anaerolineae bacterium]